MERGDKREAVVDAMLEVVAEYGFHGAPMSLVAERANVGAGTIYRYFEDKDAVIASCYQSIEERCHAAIRERYPEGRPVRERFLHVATVVARHFREAPRDLRFLQQFHDSPYGADVRREKMFGQGDKDLVRELFEEGRTQQILKDLPLPVLFALSFGPLVHICRDHAVGFLELDDRLVEQTVEACWDALKR
ncbi:MAG: TetR/AcrR family transcriptional regulator [Deltaproteobacteria bacterium]|nr:TetR/AcrR family transcriptional regulator [Deltaproteobacteria bacterium]